jgi:hypothetical protein
VPIYTTEHVLSEAGISVNETSQHDDDEEAIETPSPKKSFEMLRDNPVEVLNKMLEEAIESEDMKEAIN